MKITLSIILFLMPITVVAATPEKQSAPLCQKIYKAAASAIIAKNNGFTKEKLLSAIPSDDVLAAKPITAQKFVLISMKLITNEIFGYDNLDFWAYPSFKAEICERQLSKQPTYPNFLKYYPKLLKCNDLPENDRVHCGVEVAHEYKP